MIWDLHCHLSGVPGRTPAERMGKLIEIADRVGIERIVLCMGTRFNYYPAPDDFRRQNDEVLEAIACNPQRVLGFVYVNPQYEQESLAEIDRCVQRGPMVGVKLWVAMVCSRPPLDPIAQRAAELGVPLFQHTYYRTGPNLKDESSPADLATLANRHPQASFIAGHSGNDWERGIRAIRAAKNILADVSGCDPCAGMVEMAVRELGAERVVFGSDAAHLGDTGAIYVALDAKAVGRLQGRMAGVHVKNTWADNTGVYAAVLNNTGASGRDPIADAVERGARVLLVGGRPFGETILMWWNFVARTPEEIRAARDDWEARRRFGDVPGYPGARLAAPELAKLARPNPVS